MSDTKEPISSSSSSSSSSASSSASPLTSSSKDVAQDKMQGMRAAKKRKAEERDTTIQDLKKQVGSLADAMSNKPEVVTRQKDEETSSMPSMSTEFFRTAVVGLLGLGTFYFSNVWAKRPKLTAPVAAPTPLPTTQLPTTQLPAPPVAATQPPIVTPTPPPILPKASPTHFIDMKPKRKIGASGLLE